MYSAPSPVVATFPMRFFGGLSFDAIHALNSGRRYTNAFGNARCPAGNFSIT